MRADDECVKVTVADRLPGEFRDVGLDVNGARFLLYARKSGVDFVRTATIGRQRLNLSRDALSGSFQAFGHAVNEASIDRMLTRNDGYAEALLTQLGAQDVHSFDFSAFEGATHIWDMNRSITDEAREQYSVVLDGGCLEHVFNFPVAIKNCMEMLRVGGYYMGITPANNFMGHGFYQFSPELYFSVFTRENGFEVVDLIAFEDEPDATWYVVKNPRDVGCRVESISGVPVYLLVLAKRVAKAAVFESPPQQSDYLATWQQQDGAPAQSQPVAAPATRRTSPLGLLKRAFPEILKRRPRRPIERVGLEFDPRFFEPFDPISAERPQK